MNHPLQVARPHLAATFDGDANVALDARSRIVGAEADGSVIVPGTHFLPGRAKIAGCHGNAMRSAEL